MTPNNFRYVRFYEIARDPEFLKEFFFIFFRFRAQKWEWIAVLVLLYTWRVLFFSSVCKRLFNRYIFPRARLAVVFFFFFSHSKPSSFRSRFYADWISSTTQKPECLNCSNFDCAISKHKFNRTPLRIVFRWFIVQVQNCPLCPLLSRLPRLQYSARVKSPYIFFFFFI